MNTTPFAAPAAEPLISFRRRVSATVRWHTALATRRATDALAAAVEPRSPQILVDRLFAALSTAVRPSVPICRHAARRHRALAACALALPQAPSELRQLGSEGKLTADTVFPALLRAKQDAASRNCYVSAVWITS
jgi:hypothetical protein